MSEKEAVIRLPSIDAHLQHDLPSDDDAHHHTTTQTTFDGAHPTSAESLAERQDVRPVRLDWKPDDRDHPFRWSKTRKWSAAALALLFNSSTAFNGTAYAAARTKAVAEIGTTNTAWLLGLTAYLVPLSIMPLLLAPLTERYGRRPTNIVSMAIYTAMFLPQALVPRMDAILVSRAIQGAAGSVGNTMASAVLADLFPKEERLLPMATSVWVVFTSQAAGSVSGVWTAYADRLGWQWIFWWLGAIALGSVILVTAFLPETRSTIILKNKADLLTKQTGTPHYIDQGPISAKGALGATMERVLRPCTFFVTEPIVATLSLWVGFLWGVIFLSLEGVPITMEAYPQLDEPRRTSFLALLSLGATFGLASQSIFIRRYARARQQSPTGLIAPEIRLHGCMFAAVLTCASLFLFGWSARRNISPVVPSIGLTGFAWGVYEIYLGTLIYLADAYETYASSAVACQALMRNILAGTFGLFAAAMYGNLGTPVATSVLATIAGVLGLAPFLIVRYGPTLRRKSRVAVLLAADDARRNEEKGPSVTA